MTCKSCFFAVVAGVCALQVFAAPAALQLADVFSDHMVLQRGKPVPVWGTAAPKEQITVSFAGSNRSVQADGTGRWKVVLDPLGASSAPSELVVRGNMGDPVVIKDVLVGEVWLCSGQSNMGFPVKDCANASEEIPAADHPLLRLLAVPQNPALEPLGEMAGKWAICSPETVGSFSGTAYYFGRALLAELNVPIGLIQSAVGNTPAEAWTRLSVMEKMPVLYTKAREEFSLMKTQSDDVVNFRAVRETWEKKYGVFPPENTGFAKGWADPACDTCDWQSVKLPRSWEQLGYKTGGVFWVRKDVELPESAMGKPFFLSLMGLDEQYETVYFNGIEVARTADTPPQFYMRTRRCQIPGRLVRAGRNVIAVRIVSASEKSVFQTFGRSLGLPGIAPGAVSDQWLLKQESGFPVLSPGALAERPKPNTIVATQVSSALYNGMIAPLIPFAIRGVIWYQGESNGSRHSQYRELLSLMICDWRAQWGSGDFPFIIQQLANFGMPTANANENANWSFLREAQAQVADTLTNCWMAIGLDLGDARDIHPKNKQDVGKRLALVALEHTYDRNVESSGPRYQRMMIENGRIRLTFTHADGLIARDGPLRRFAIAGDDQKFVWAEAVIEGDTVVVRSPQVPRPVAVRYAWAFNPEGCNLYNSSGLPASPFRTDNW